VTACRGRPNQPLHLVGQLRSYEWVTSLDRAQAFEGYSLRFRLEEGGIMNRERALKVALVLVGLVFSAVALKTADEAMILSVDATLGIFLLLAARDPSAHRSVIAFTAGSSFAHAAVMAVMSIQMPTARAEWLITSVVLSVIGVLLIVLAPGRQTAARAAAA
jgi:hypothetical protein